VSRVLAVGRGPADLVAFAGGTLARLAERGDAVALAAAADGQDAGVTTHDEVGAAVAEALGADWIGTAPVTSDEDGHAVRDPLMDVIRQAKPDVILAPSARAGDRLPLVELAFYAAYCSNIPNYRSPKSLESASIRAAIFGLDEPSAGDFLPDTYVDVCAHWPRKLALLELCGDAGAEILPVAETVSRARGVQMQVEFAEAFRAKRVWGRLRPYPLLP
jgi:LmbE family N-acetylglucosaminyl deacetylase